MIHQQKQTFFLFKNLFGFHAKLPFSVGIRKSKVIFLQYLSVTPDKHTLERIAFYDSLHLLFYFFYIFCRLEKSSRNFFLISFSINQHIFHHILRIIFNEFSFSIALSHMLQPN